MGDELRDPCLPYLYCNPRRTVYSDQKMMVITVDDSRGHNDVLVVTSQGMVGWIDKHSLEILLLYQNKGEDNMSISLKVGQNILEHPRYQIIKSYNLSRFGLSIGDLVTVTEYQYPYGTGGTLYRITGENLPCLDAVWGVKTCKIYKKHYASQASKHQTYERMGWLDKKGKLLNPSQVIGTVELTPVFSFMSNKESKKKKKLRYDCLKYKVKKIDIITLGKSFASYKEFIDSEVKRLQEDSLSLDTWCWQWRMIPDEWIL